MQEVNLRELAVDREPESYSGVSGRLTARRRVMTRYLLPLCLVLGFLSLVGWASRDLLFPPVSVTVVPVYVTTAEIRQEGTPLFQAAGWIEPRPTPIRVAALAPGVVEDLLVVEDQSLKSGQPVAELVKDDARLSYQSALADLELRQAELDQAKASFSAAKTRFLQPVHLKAALGQADASLAKIGTELRNLPFEIRRAESDFAALQQDFDGKQSARGVVAAVEIDIAKSKADSAKAMVEELADREKSLEEERKALGRRRDAVRTQLELLADETKAKDESQAKVKAAQARVAQANVVVAQAKLRLNRMTVRAPVDGRVYRLIADPGTSIGSGMTQMAGHDGSTIVTMYRPEMLQVRVDTRFEDIPKIGLGQKVEINNPALSAPMIGEVLFISSEADIQKNTLEVKVAIPDPPEVLKPEMLVDVTFLSIGVSGGGQRSRGNGDQAGTQEQGSAIRTVERSRIFLPRNLIQQDEGSPHVWLADQSASVARIQRVQMNDHGAGDLVEITDGLNVSSRIIFNTEELTNGCRIRITGEQPSTASLDLNSSL